MQDVAAVVTSVGMAEEREVVTYQQLFQQLLNIDPLTAPLETIVALAKQKIDIDACNEDKDFWLDLLLTHCIEPELGRGKLTFVIDYPESQAALAKIKINSAGCKVAERFELYIEGVEIANGYSELTDPGEYLQRFIDDNNKRENSGIQRAEIDQDFLQAIEKGLPACSGVAMGVDRLMLVAGLE